MMKNAKNVLLSISMLAMFMGLFVTGPFTPTAKASDVVVCSCGLIWGKGCKADNWGARCNGLNSPSCSLWDGNCEDVTVE